MKGNIAPAFTMRDRKDESPKTLSPGPGNYNNPKVFHQLSKQYSFNKSSRSKTPFSQLQVLVTDEQ